MTSPATTFGCLELNFSRSAELSEAITGLYARTRALFARSRELCLAYPRIRGASDVDSPLIAEIIAKTSMCADCLGKKVGMPAASVAEALDRLGAFVRVTTQEQAQCDGCLERVTTFHIMNGFASNGIAAAPARAAAVTKNDALWRFLESHRGAMFCTQCIANAMFVTKRIDRAVIGAEGRGARRQYGTCATCGKERLLCGLGS